MVTVTNRARGAETPPQRPRGVEKRSTQRVIAWGLAVSVVATLLAFPFESVGAQAWTGLLFLLSALALLPAALLLAWRAGQEGSELAAVGFVTVAFYALGTTVDAALLARDLPEASVGMLPATWALLALGLILVGSTSHLPGWVRLVGAGAAVGHLVATVAVLFGAEMPPTGAEPTAWAPMVVAGSKLLYLATLVGWAMSIRAPRR
ncbi:MAG: hypothetical protein EA388_00350 [Nitriliruptor sp.]|nr:MAG: hypothetical protein EA388_00350 [Nitriliruptor sp.]